MSYPRINAVAINGVDSVAPAIPGVVLSQAGVPTAVFDFAVDGTVALEFGALTAKVGQDVELYLPGVDLLRTDWHSAEGSQPGANTDFLATGYRALAIGALQAEAGEVAGQAQSACALTMGELAAEEIAYADGAKAFGAGDLSPSLIARAGSSQALSFGRLSVVHMQAVPGLQLCRGGNAQILISGQQGQAEGGVSIGFGDMAVGYVVYARQSLALGMGAVEVRRDGAC